MKTNRSALLVSISLSIYVLSICWFAYVYQNGLMDKGLFFNSDALYYSTIFKNIFSDGKHFSDWLLPPSLFLFPDGLIYALAYIISKNALSQIFAFAILQSLLYFLLSCILLNIFLRRSSAIAYSALISSNIIVLGIYSSNPYGFSFISVFHFGSLVSFLLLTVLCLKYLVAKTTKEKCIIGISSFVLAGFSIISDRLVLLQFVAPILIIGIYFYYTRLKNKEILKFWILLMIGYLFAFVIENMFFPKVGKLDSEIGFGSISNKLIMLFDWAINMPMLIQANLLLLPIAIFTTLVFLKRNRNNIDPRSAQKELLAILLSVSVFLALLVTGLSSRDFTSRYLLPYIFFPPLFLFIFLNQKKANILVVVILCSAALASFAAHGKSKSIYTLYPGVVECIDAISQKHAVRRGIAQYWDASPIYVFSSAGLIIAPVLNDGSPMMWITNSSEFSGKFSFAIIDNSASSFYQISRKAIEQRLSRKPFEYQCYDKTVLIFDNEAISLPRHSDISNIRSSALESFIKNPRALLIMAQQDFENGDRESATRLLSEAIALLKQSGARDETVKYYESELEKYQP